MIGVSPAYFVSLYGKRFSPNDVIRGLDVLAEIGFDGFQGEIYDADDFDRWISGGWASVEESAKGIGLTCTQFVAHFLAATFCDGDVIASNAGYHEFETLASVVGGGGSVKTICIPISPFVGDTDDPLTVSDAATTRIYRYAESAWNHDLDFCVELLPGGIYTGSGDLARALVSSREDLSGRSIGICLDTGHAHTSKERLGLVPGRLPVLATHLCDNDGATNASLTPGDGTVPWREVFIALERSGYRGSFDVEISCEPAQATTQYARAFDFVTRFHHETRYVEESRR